MPTAINDPAPTGDGARYAIDYLRMLLSGNAEGLYTDHDVLERMREVIDRGAQSSEDGATQPWPRPFAELQGDSGLLWLINRQVFHPWGYALGIAKDAEGIALGWTLLGDGSEPYNFEDGTETDYMHAAARTLGGAR